MRGVQLLADGHHVDEAGNLICCTQVDLRDPAERTPIGTLKRASSKRDAIPGCGTIWLSKPGCLGDGGEGRPAAAGSRASAWVCCAFIEPETEGEHAAWRAGMPAGRDAVSPIRRPREFARALGAMAAEQIGPRGRTLTLRSTADGQMFGTPHRSQTVYHGPVVYADDPYRRLESASSVLEFTLLLIFMKPAAHRAQREYRFGMDGGRAARSVGGLGSLAGAARRDAEAAEGARGQRSRVRRRGRVLGRGGSGRGRPVRRANAGRGAAPSSRGLRSWRRRATTPRAWQTSCARRRRAHAAVEALRAAVGRLDAASSSAAAAAAWHAEPVVRLFCSTYGGGIAGVRVSDDSFIVITADVSGDEPVEVTIAVGPDGTCACKVGTARGHVASAAPDPRSFEQVLKSRLAEVGVQGHGGTEGGGAGDRAATGIARDARGGPAAE